MGEPRLDNDEVIIPAATAARLAPLVTGVLRRARRDGRTVPPDLATLAEALAAAETKAAHYTSPVPPVAATGSTPSRSEAGRSVHPAHAEGATVGAVEAARRAGVSRRGLVKAARGGRLPGRQNHTGAWRFRPEDLDQWIAAREARMARKTAVATRDQTTEVDTVADLRTRLAEAENALREFEAEKARLEHRRDAAAALMEAIKAGRGGVVDLWRAEETYREAEDALAALMRHWQPTRDMRDRLASILGPIEQRRREAAQRRVALQATRKLAEVLPLLDQVDAVIEEAREIGAEAGGEFRIPTSLTEFQRRLGPRATSAPRFNLQSQIASAQRDLPAHIAALEEGGR